VSNLDQVMLLEDFPDEWVNAGYTTFKR